MHIKGRCRSSSTPVRMEDVSGPEDRVRNKIEGLLRRCKSLRLGSTEIHVPNGIVTRYLIEVGTTVDLIVSVVVCSVVAVWTGVVIIMKRNPGQLHKQHRNSLSWRRRPQVSEGTPFSQYLVCGSQEDSANSHKRVEGADDRRSWCTTIYYISRNPFTNRYVLGSVSAGR